MSSSVLLTILLLLPFTTGETEEVCAGKEFRLPVYSTFRTVTFTPDSGEPERVLLENTSVKDPRFELTKDRMLVLREVTESDQGLYSIKLTSGFTYETLQLKVLDCPVSYKSYYGENFRINISENASLLEFSPAGAPAEAKPVVLWNRTHPEASNAARGRLEQGGKVWVVEGVSPADQGNYTIRNAGGNVLSRSRLTVFDWFVISKTEEVCAGKDFHLSGHFLIRKLTFAPDSGEPRRVLLENNSVKDPRFELTKGRTLVLREVTESDQGLYSIKLSSGITYETLQLKVLDCPVSYKSYYGENFRINISENASLLEFSPAGAPAEAKPVVLWNRTHPEASNAARGRLEQGGKVWVVEGVSPADQGNYTIRNASGKVLSNSKLTVLAHSFSVSRSVKESINLPLPVSHAILTFIPTNYYDKADSMPHYGPARLIRNGKVTNSDVRFRNLISVRGNGFNEEVVITGLKSSHTGKYEIRDRSDNLVSTTTLQVDGEEEEEEEDTLSTVYTFLRALSGVFLAMAGLILFLKRFPCCSISQLTSGLRRKPKPAANPPEVSIQDYSQTSTQPSGYDSNVQRPETPRKWTPRSSPSRTGYSSVTVDTPKARLQELSELTASDSPGHNNASNGEERAISFFVPGSSDLLHSSEDCMQFPIKKGNDKAERGKSPDCFSALPLDENTSEYSSVYTSEKLKV